MSSEQPTPAVPAGAHSASPDAALFDESPIVLFRWRAAAGWPVEYVSQSVRQFAVEPADLLSGKVPYASLVHPDDLMRVATEVGEFSAAGRVTFEQDYRLVLPDGRMVWIYDFTRVLRDASGQVTHYEGYVLDITARKLAEAALRDRIAESEQQRQAIISLSTPIIEVWDGLLTLPIIGSVDTERAQHITESLLRRVTETRCRAVILDLTAVEAIDTATAGHLLRIVQALRLLGVQCSLCGIGPQLARTIASLGLDLADVPTMSQLKEALRQFLLHQGIQTKKAAPAAAPASPGRAPRR